jgi:predicted SAM-dependent methyltransferase
VHDLLNFPYPFEIARFDKIYLRHVIEHFSIDSINSILIECDRLLKPNGEMIISVPHVFSISAFIDPTHQSYFTFGSGQYWDRNNSKAYYSNIQSSWNLFKTTCIVNSFDWKRYRFRILNRFLSSFVEYRINKAISNKNNPSLADRIVKKGAYQLVEIKWSFKKVNGK